MEDIFYKHQQSGQPDDALAFLHKFQEEKKQHAATVHPMNLAYRQTCNKRIFHIFQEVAFITFKHPLF